MSRFIVIIVALFASVSLMASDVSVYKIVGVIKMKKQDSWKNIEKQFNLKETDIILIGKNSLLSLVDKSNCRIYTYETEGEWKVSEIIHKCEADSRSITSRLLQEAKKDIKNSKQKTFVSLGGVKRDAMNEDLLENVYTQLCNFISKNDQRQSSIIILKQMKKGDGTSYFVIENNSENTLYANVLYRPAKNTIWTVLYECPAEMPCLEIPAKSSLEMKHITILENEGECVLFALRNQIDSGELAYMFEEKLEPEEIDRDYPMEFFKIRQ